MIPFGLIEYKIEQVIFQDKEIFDFVKNFMPTVINYKCYKFYRNNNHIYFLKLYRRNIYNRSRCNKINKIFMVYCSFNYKIGFP